MKTLLVLLTLSILGCSSKAKAVDLGQIEKDLGAKGVEGWVHGAIGDRDLYAFTYRNPKNFFDNIIMSLVTDQPDIIAKLQSVGRHHKVLVKGRFLKNPSPQKHIEVASLEIVKKFESGYATAPYPYDAKIPGDLLKAGSETFLVHAIGGDGRILVLEYKDAVVPMYVKNPELTKNFARNDMVKLAYKIQDKPEGPTHLNLDETAAQPVKVVEAIGALHGKPASFEGALILFPKSPEILFNVFAIQQELPSGLKRQFTIVNFDDAEAFKKVREKLQKAWDKFPADFSNARNKLVHRRIRVKATGVYNQVDANQANPQILVKDADALEIIER